MTRKITRWLPGLSVGLLVLFTGGCTNSTSNKGFLDLAFKQSPPEHIRLLPIIEARKEITGFYGDDLLAHLESQFISSIENRGFKIEKTVWPSNQPVIPPSEIETMNPAEFKPFLPQGDSPVVLLILNDAYVHNIIGQYLLTGHDSQITITGMAFDPTTCNLLWKNTSTAHSEFGLAYFLDAIALGLTSNAAANECVKNLADTFPFREGKAIETPATNAPSNRDH